MDVVLHFVILAGLVSLALSACHGPELTGLAKRALRGWLMLVVIGAILCVGVLLAQRPEVLFG